MESVVLTIDEMEKDGAVGLKESILRVEKVDLETDMFIKQMCLEGVYGPNPDDGDILMTAMLKGF